MTSIFLFDTDILIDYLRDRAEAVAYIESCTEPMLMSVVTAAELYAGVREGNERVQLDQFLLAFSILPLTSEIAVLGGLLRRDYGKSYGTRLADALIAATVQVHRCRLVGLNRKHFPMLSDMIVPY
jgi:predicted nucleic acid-binding protein